MDQEIRNRILTEFQVSGEQKAEQAVNRLSRRTLEARVEARQATDATEQWTRAVRQIERQKAIENVARQFERATKNTQDWAGAVKQVQLQLDQLGASAEEVELVARRAAEAGTSSRLRSFGRAARTNLPAVPIGGFSSEQIARAVEGFGAVSEAMNTAGLSAGRMVLAFGGVTAALALVGAIAVTTQKQIEEAEKRRLAQLSAEERAQRAALVSTSEELRLLAEVEQQELQFNKTRLESLKVQRDSAQQTLNDLTFSAEGLQRQMDEALERSPWEKIIGLFTGDLGESQNEINETRGELNAFNQEIARLETEVTKGEAALQEYNNVLREGATLANDEAAARERAQAITDERIRTQLAGELAVANMSADAIEQRLQAINREQLALLAVSRAGEASAEMLDQITQRQRELAAEGDILAQALPDKQRAEETARIFRESVDAVRAHDEAMLKLTESRAEREADIYGKLNDNLVKIAERAADATERTLQQLQNRRDDLARDLGRDFRDEQRKADLEALEERIKYQQQEAKSYRDHLRDLRRIREDAQAAEFDLVRNRDFTGLRDLRVETNRRLNEQNRAFIEERKERELAFAENVRDEQRQRQFERESRLLRYQDALDDAQIAADRELAQIQEKRQRELAAQQAAARQELALLNQKHRQEIVMRRDALTAELKLVAQGNAARLRMEEQFLFARAQLYRAGGIFGSLGNFVGGTTNNSSSYTNAPVFNVQTGGNASQTNQLVSLIENVVQRAFMQYARN